MTEFRFNAIGIVHSCFKEKFGVPRQPGLVPSASASIEMLEPFNNAEAFVGLDQCSHIWLQFVFHKNRTRQWKARVKPPRLGGNKTMGVFATRSPVRPNPIGLSVVKLEGLRFVQKTVHLDVSGADLVQGTPILDIKPYVPYADAVSGAENLMAPEAPEEMHVVFSAAADRFCDIHADDSRVNLRRLLVEVLRQNPRPSYQSFSGDRVYGTRLFNFDVRWRCDLVHGLETICVVEIVSE